MSSQLAQAERAILLACEETCESMCQLSSVNASVPQELFIMQRYSAHIESILQFLQAKESSVGFLKKNGGKCIDAALTLAEWYRLTNQPLRALSMNDVIVAMWDVLSQRQLNSFGVQCALWLRSSLHLLSSSECHKWFAVIRSISSSTSQRLLTPCQLLCASTFPFASILLLIAMTHPGTRRPWSCLQSLRAASAAV